MERYPDKFLAYQKSPWVKLLLKHGIDIRERLEYFHGFLFLHSISLVAMVLNEENIYEIIIKNLEKFNPPKELKKLWKNSYNINRLRWRKNMIKILKKYSTVSDTSTISDKRANRLFAWFKDMGCPYMSLKFLLSKDIDIRQNIPLLKAFLSSRLLIRWAIIAGEADILKLIIKHKKHLDVYSDWQIDNVINFQLAEIGKNKQILTILQDYRDKMDKQSFINKWYHLADAERFDDLMELVEGRLNFDKSLKEWWWWYLKAFGLNRNKKYKEASSILKRRLLFNPNDIDALSSLSNSFQNLWEDKKALMCINKIIKIFSGRKSSFWGWYSTKARILHTLWKYSLAMKYYRKEIRHDLEWHNKQNNLDWIKRCKKAIHDKD